MRAKKKKKKKQTHLGAAAEGMPAGQYFPASITVAFLTLKRCDFQSPSLTGRNKPDRSGTQISIALHVADKEILPSWQRWCSNH
jgi:hypothetical protein